MLDMEIETNIQSGSSDISLIADYVERVDEGEWIQFEIMTDQTKNLIIDGQENLLRIQMSKRSIQYILH